MLRALSLFAAAVAAVLLAGSTPVVAGSGACDASSDTDCDGILDFVDNCVLVPNAPPADCDTDGDGYGNACDGDFDNSGVVNATDFTDIFVPAFNTGTASAAGTDMDCGGVVNATDFTSHFVPQFNQGTPGPSCCAP